MVVYSKDSDNVNEQVVADKITEARGYNMVKLSKFHPMDYVCYRGWDLLNLIEIKCRSVPMAKYDTTMIGLDKVIYARNVKQHFDLNCFLFVQWTDQLGYISLNQPCNVDLGGRADRGDANDVGLYAYYDIERFKTL